MTNTKHMMQVHTKQIWQNFLEWVNNDDNTFYRGVSDSINHMLLPSIGRYPNYDLQKEVDLFEHFRLKSNLFLKTTNDFELLALAQHHGLPTRLLDWTTNPLIAAYFAVRENSKTDGRIYVIKPNIDSFVDPLIEESPFLVNQIKFLFPPVSTRRIELQKGLFSVHPIPVKPAIIIDEGVLLEIDYAARDLQFYINKQKVPEFTGDYIEYQKKYFEDRHQSCFTIPANCKLFFEEQLRNLGIDEMIFGDIDAISEHLKYQFSKNKLHGISKLNTKHAFPLLERIIEGSGFTSICLNPPKFSTGERYFIIGPKFKVRVKDIQKNYSKIDTVIGDITMQLIPNILDLERIFISDKKALSDIDKCQYILSKTSKLYNSKLPFRRISFKFSADFYFYSDIENAIIDKIEIEVGHDNNLLLENINKDYQVIQCLFNMIKNDLDIDEMKACEIESSEMEAIIEEVKLKKRKDVVF